jgi:hypothetical protein
MLWLVPLTISLACGWFVARALTAGAWNGPRWATLLVELSLGTLLGPGLASVLYFALVVTGSASRGAVVGMLAALLAASAGLWWKLTPASSTSGAALENRFPYVWALWIAVGVGLVFFVMDFQSASSANPAGEWDAMSIWNLRARYLASGGDSWRRAVSSEMGGHMTGSTHPGYPLFLSGFIAIQWSTAGGFDEMTPIAVSLLFAAGAMILLGASLASRRSVTLGLLAWLVLLASEVFASQAAAQYSDLLQSLAFLSALVLLEAADEHAEPRVVAAAGLAIGLSCWIKNEGWPFSLAALGVGLWRFRSRGAVWLVVGVLPGFLATAVLKMFFVQGREDMFPRTVAETMDKIAGAGRWWQAALGFGKAIFDAGSPWTHPVLLMAVLAIAFGFLPAAARRSRKWLWIPIAATAAAEYGLYLITTANLDWHISTTVSRLLAQMWPSLIWLFFLLLRAPEDAFAPAQPAAAGSSIARSQRKRR